MEHEAQFWLTRLFNEYLGSALTSFLTAIGHPPANAAHPWQNWIVTEILVVAIIMVLFAILRAGLSVEKPGKFQLTFEAIYSFVSGQAHDAIDHGASKSVSFFGTLFIFILFMNLIGVIPGIESPTMTPAVPAGLRRSSPALTRSSAWASHRGPRNSASSFDSGPSWAVHSRC